MFERLDDEPALLGEGPVWVAAEQCLYWVDIKGHRLHRYDPTCQTAQSWSFPDNLAWVLPRLSGGLVAGTRHSIGFLTISEELVFTPYAEIEADIPTNRLNDAKVDIDGTILFGTMDDQEAAATGSLYRLSPDFAVEKLDSGYIVSNGPAIDPALRRVYHTDSAFREIYQFDCVEGKLRNKRRFIQFSSEDGFPDGMTVDCEGGLWVAHWGGGRVSRFLPDGRLDYFIPFPTSLVTSCCFGGAHLNELFITTASIGFTAEQMASQPHAGGLFRVRVGVKGVESNAFWS